MAFTGVFDSAPAAVPANTLYPVMAAPPFDDGAAHVRLVEPLPGTAARFLGAVGAVAGVIETSADLAPRPARLMARTTK